MIDKEDWLSWKNHPVTRAYRDLIQQEMATMEFHVDLDSVDKTALAAVYNVGRRIGLQEAIDLLDEGEMDGTGDQLTH